MKSLNIRAFKLNIKNSRSNGDCFLTLIPVPHKDVAFSGVCILFDGCTHSIAITQNFGRSICIHTKQRFGS
jgi:hypothetical protein